MELEAIAACCLMLTSMAIATQGWGWLICVFVCLPILLVIHNYRTPSKNRTRFFLSWSVVSFFFLMGVFELEVVPYLEIMFIENFILMCFVACMCLCVYFVKSNPQPVSFSSHMELTKRAIRCEACSAVQLPRTYHCERCECCIHKRDHHSVWLDACIGSSNHRCFVIAILCLTISCFYSSNLTLTTICHPTLVGGIFLVPDDCSDVFGDIHMAICFVSAVYSLLIAAFGVYLFSQQLWLISHNTTYQEWRQGQLDLYSNGIIRNISDFCRGRA